MELTTLTALSPIDGRYHTKTYELQPLLSEYGLIKHRVWVEIRWLQLLIAQLPELASFKNDKKIHDDLEKIIDHFSLADAEKIKTIESTTQHDVKAVEYFIKEKIVNQTTLKPLSEFIHFACTSEDINNLAYAQIIKTTRDQHLIPYIDQIITALRTLAHRYAALPMLARTHGQPATPTTLGKELANTMTRLHHQRDHLAAVNVMAKFNGAVGNFNAHYAAYPNIDWPMITQQWINALGLSYNAYTTQIEPHDYIAELAHACVRCNTILIDFARDIWSYISLGYFKQRVNKDEVGSSTMPHKVNPIDFENAEGNFALSTALFNHMAITLPISRWQRDLTDSTLLRNLGATFGYMLIALQSLFKGIEKLEANDALITHDLNQHWEVLAEAIQTIMRRYGIEQPYEKLKALTRGQTIDQAMLQKFISQLNIPEEAKQQLLSLTPSTYLGAAQQLAESS